MKNNKLYKRLKDIALKDNFTIPQVRALRYGQVAELVESRAFTNTFLNNAKTSIITAIQAKVDKVTVKEFTKDHNVVETINERDGLYVKVKLR